MSNTCNVCWWLWYWTWQNQWWLWPCLTSNTQTCWWHRQRLFHPFHHPSIPPFSETEAEGRKEFLPSWTKLESDGKLNKESDKNLIEEAPHALIGQAEQDELENLQEAATEVPETQACNYRKIYVNSMKWITLDLNI